MGGLAASQCSPLLPSPPTLATQAMLWTFHVKGDCSSLVFAPSCFQFNLARDFTSHLLSPSRSINEYQQPLIKGGVTECWGVLRTKISSRGRRWGGGNNTIHCMETGLRSGSVGCLCQSSFLQLPLHLGFVWK